MNKLKMTLKSDNEIIINEEYDYKIIDKKICFKVKDLLLKVLIDDDEFKFERISKNDSFTIYDNRDTNDRSCILKLTDKNVEFEIKIKELEYKRKGDEINFKYNIESEENVTKFITITLIK